MTESRLLTNLIVTASEVHRLSERKCVEWDNLAAAIEEAKAALVANAETDAAAPGDTSLVSGVSSDPIPSPVSEARGLRITSVKLVYVKALRTIVGVEERHADKIRDLLAAARDVSEAEVIERCCERITLHCVKMDWPPDDGDKLIDDLHEAVRALSTPIGK